MKDMQAQLEKLRTDAAGISATAFAPPTYSRRRDATFDLTQ
jgi:hypothetical protein